jgi:hypothetical protein
MNVDDIKFKPLGAILFVAGLGILGLAYKEQRKHGPLFQEPRTTEGKVLERFTATGKTEPVLMLRVEVEQGESKRVIERKVEEDFWNAHDRGSTVEVAYYGTDVGKGVIAGASSGYLYFWLKVSGGGVVMVLGLVVLGYDRWRV